MNKKIEELFDREFGEVYIEDSPNAKTFIAHSLEIRAFIDKHFVAKEEVKYCVNDFMYGKDNNKNLHFYCENCGKEMEYEEEDKVCKTGNLYTKQEVLDMIGKDSKHAKLDFYVDTKLLSDYKMMGAFDWVANKVKQDIRDKLEKP